MRGFSLTLAPGCSRRFWKTAGVPEPELTTRSATPDDVDAVLAFWERAAENADRPADSAEAVTRLIARDPEALLLSLDGEQIVGSLIVGWDGWRSHLYRLAVAPDRRRLGIGRALLDAAEQRLTAAGARRIDAMVLDSNRPAHELWSRAGYTRQSTWARWIKPISRRATRA
jgi:ribosomal protein S18 acetylase RimI-like enzyme